MRLSQEITPSLKVLRTQATLVDPGPDLTYNEIEVIYNDSRYSYGGVSGLSDVTPIFTKIFNITPIVIANRTQSEVSFMDASYNEQNVVYNDILYSYGGYTGLTDVVPIFNHASIISPSVVRYADIYTNATPPTPGDNSKIPIGPGFFLFITYK